ncbi:MAG: glycoside hydrolase family 97 protein, partial [Desulfobacterales bacterium]|nr:glycoside hydrolase family 97 protein [Desulfobacterales bacterium]
GILGENPQLSKLEKNKISEVLKPLIKVKTVTISNECNELIIYFKNNYYLILRAYNNGFAYRFGTEIENEITVLSETGKYVFTENHMMWWGKEKTFESHNQVYFDYQSLRNTGAKDLASLPLIIDPAKGPKIVITETDLIDYPGMWLRGNNSNMLYRVAANYPKIIVQKSDRYLPIKERENYIAKTSGTRSFPWRIFAIAENDADLITNQLTYILASPNKIEDASWIKPGKVAWDWWNANNIYGVDFEAGVNTETYKYYIDFAAEYGIENILLDEGWYVLGDMSAVVPEIDMEEIIAYGKSKNVGIILWCVWKTLDDQLEESFNQFEVWGIKGIKVDFMNRDDQQMVNYYHKIAKIAAEHKLLVDFHGSYKPAGIRRMYPNVLTREGVNGGEQFKWSMRQTPEHDLIIPFGRMMAGPMDYTPGAMNNAQQKDYKPIFDTPMSTGTRCHQLAMFVCYESPLQMLCDAPSNYYKEPECMEFLSAVPTVWDETIVLEAKVSDYFLVARRNADNWYIGGMTDWDARDLDLNLSFLPEGKKYQMTLYQDGKNADRIAIDFKQSKQTVDNSWNQKIHLAKG